MNLIDKIRTPHHEHHRLIQPDDTGHLLYSKPRQPFHSPEKTHVDPGQRRVELGLYKVSLACTSINSWECGQLVGKSWKITCLSEVRPKLDPGSRFSWGKAHIMTPELASCSPSLQPNRVLGRLRPKTAENMPFTIWQKQQVKVFNPWLLLLWHA